MPPHIHTYQLTPRQQTLLKELLEQGNYLPVNVPYSTLAVKTPTCRITLYTSGKCVIQGKTAAEFVEFQLEPQVIFPTQGPPQPTPHETPHFGVDESGKGDYFGPLCTCAVYTDADLSPQLLAAGAKDCKVISDQQVLKTGPRLRAILGNRYSLVMINPERYNQIRDQRTNLNRLLAWCHAKAICKALEQTPTCPRALSDQFGNPQLIQGELDRMHCSIHLDQRPRAETDVAVAAASVIARECFLRQLAKLSDLAGMPLPKGATHVVDAAVQLVRTKGVDSLKHYCKLHFKTTEAVLAKTGAAS